MPILPDVLEPNLKLVICGNAAGTTSARMGQYYATKGNLFWETLFKTGLTPRQLAPREFPILPRYGIGLTDIAKDAFGMDKNLDAMHFERAALDILVKKIETHAPRVVAFHGKKGATALFKAYYDKTPDFGRQTEKIGSTILFVLPQTSGANRANWERKDYMKFWQEMAGFVQSGE